MKEGAPGAQSEAGFERPPVSDEQRYDEIGYQGLRKDPTKLPADRDGLEAIDEEELTPIWRIDEPFDPRLVAETLGIAAEPLPPYGRSPLYRWTFPDPSRRESRHWVKRLDMITDDAQIRLLAYGLPRPNLLTGSDLLKD